MAAKKTTKSVIYFNGYYAIERVEVDRDGIEDWVSHLRSKVWFTPNEEKRLRDWYRQ